MIYIGIPARDERHTIGPLLWRIREILLGSGRGFHVLVVDDASEDGTPEALEPYRRVLPLSVIRHSEPRGYGCCLERLVREAVGRSDYLRRDALVTLQADFTDPPEDIPEMVRRFEGGADLVVTAGRGHEISSRRERLARTGARLLSRRWPLPDEIEEPCGSLRLYRLFVLERALREVAGPEARLLSYDGWAASLELLVRVASHVRRVDRVEGSEAPGRRYRDTRLRALWELSELRRLARDPGLRDLARPA